MDRWRRGRDSNPRYPCRYAAFRVRCMQPLCHLSAVRKKPEQALIGRGYVTKQVKTDKGGTRILPAKRTAPGPSRQTMLSALKLDSLRRGLRAILLTLGL